MVIDEGSVNPGDRYVDRDNGIWTVMENGTMKYGNTMSCLTLADLERDVGPMEKVELITSSDDRKPDMVNEWTSNDVPSVSSLDLYNRRPDLDLDGKRFGAAAALEAVVAHLNANGGLPAADDRWRRAHEIVEGERDLARERLREVDSDLARCMSDYQDVEDARDEWRARAEAAEARTAVTREDVEKVVHGSGGGFFDSRLDAIADAVCDLLGVEAGQGADPVEELARELFNEAGRGNSGIEFDEISPDHRGEYLRIARHVLGREASGE